MAKTDTTAGRGRPAISEQKLKSLLRSQKSHQDDIDQIVGTQREEIANAVEKHHLNKKMFGWTKQLDKMESEKLAMMLDDFDHYRDISGLDARAAKVQNLDLEAKEEGEEEGEESGEGEPEPPKKRGRPSAKVTPIRPPSSIAAE